MEEVDLRCGAPRGLVVEVAGIIAIVVAVISAIARLGAAWMNSHRRGDDHDMDIDD